MSNWEVKDAWQKGNGDWVLTVGPGVEPAGSVFGGTMIFSMIILEIYKQWGEHGALAIFGGMIAGMMDVMVMFIGFYLHFWLMLAWSVAAIAAWSAAFLKTPWIVKIPGFIALLWVLDQMLMLAKMRG